MSSTLLNVKETKENYEVISFIESLDPKMLEKLKTIMWWERMQQLKQEEPESA